jgi:hypothetical protein
MKDIYGIGGKGKTPDISVDPSLSGNAINYANAGGRVNPDGSMTFPNQTVSPSTAFGSSITGAPRPYDFGASIPPIPPYDPDPSFNLGVPPWMTYFNQGGIFDPSKNFPTPYGLQPTTPTKVKK